MTAQLETLDAGTEQQLDEVLVKIHHTSPLWAEHLANHAPMAAESLTRLGRADAIADFYAGYRGHLDEWPLPASAALPDWHEQLGQRSAVAALVGHFQHRIEDDGVEPVLRAVVPTLLAGILAGSLHGLLRLSHAVRSWQRVDSELRRREVATALGYWAAEYAPLAGDVGSDAIDGNDAVTALRGLSPLPAAMYVDGIITERAQASEGSPKFLHEVRAVQLDAWSVSRTLSELCGVAADLMLATEDRRCRFAYLHALTGSSALRVLLPLLDDSEQRRALLHHWHAVAAIHCMCAGSPAPSSAASTSGELPPSRVNRDALVSLAVGSLDDHAIKVTAAALQEFALSDNVQLLRAAWCYAAAAAD